MSWFHLFLMIITQKHKTNTEIGLTNLISVGNGSVTNHCVAYHSDLFIVFFFYMAWQIIISFQGGKSYLNWR